MERSFNIYLPLDQIRYGNFYRCIPNRLGAICSKTRIHIFNQLKKTESYQFFEISNGISCFKIVHSPDEKILRINNSTALSYINCTQLIIEFCTKDLEKGTRPFYLCRIHPFSSNWSRCWSRCRWSRRKWILDQIYFENWVSFWPIRHRFIRVL